MINTNFKTTRLLQLGIIPMAIAAFLLSCSTTDISEEQALVTPVEEIDATISRIMVSPLSEEEKQALLASDPKALEDPLADYQKITLVHTNRDGSITEKVYSYVKALPVQEFAKSARSINPHDLAGIMVTSVTQSEMDSLKAISPKLYGIHPIENYKKIVYKLKDGTSIQEFELNPFRVQ